MKDLPSPKFITGALWIGAAGTCAVAEVLAALAFRKMPNYHPFMGLGMKYIIGFIVALPMVAGVNGYYSVRRRVTSAGVDVISVLSSQFLIATITAYVALLFCVGPLAEALHRTLKVNVASSNPPAKPPLTRRKGA